MKILPPNSLSLLLLAPLSGMIGIAIGYGGILYLNQLYPDAVNRIGSLSNNYYLAYFIFNLLVLRYLLSNLLGKNFYKLLQINFVVWILYGYI